MSPAEFSDRFLLIIFLQLLRSTTTSPSPSPSPASVPTSVKEDTANLPLIVFQHHHHSHRNLGDFPTTQLPASHEDYYAYNVMSAGGQEGVEERGGEEEEQGGGVRKHHHKLDELNVDELGRKNHYKLDDSNVDELVDTVARKHHYKLDDSKVDELVRKHHYKLDDHLNVDELVRKHHYKLDDPNVDELVAFRGKKHHSNSGETTSKSPMRTLYQVGDSDSSLPVCGRWAVCGKIDIYDPSHPWLEKQCRCPEGDKTAKGASSECSTLQTAHDGHTVVDKTRHYKVCEPVHKLPRCRYFRDVTWTLRTEAGNGTQQTMHCLCPRGSVAYLIKRLPYQTSNNAIGYQYSFACSPQSRLRCQRKEPCRLFTVRRRQELLDEVNTNTLCQCPRDHTCPTHHTHTAGVVQGKTYLEENVRTYSGYCLPNN